MSGSETLDYKQEYKHSNTNAATTDYPLWSLLSQFGLRCPQKAQKDDLISLGKADGIQCTSNNQSINSTGVYMNSERQTTVGEIEANEEEERPR